MLKSAHDSPITLSVVIPCYNEAGTLAACLDRVFAIQDETLRLDVIVVDDASSDGSAEIAERCAATHPGITVLRHSENQGKGAALRTGIRRATGDLVAIQDADLEYNPRDLKRMMTPILFEEADVVLGTRFSTSGAHRVLYFWHYMGNRFLTLLSNMLTDLNITDMECCYKVFRRDIIQAIEIQESRFGVEPELVAKVAQMRVRIFEMGVSYSGRTYEEGKKIGVRDGFRALHCILRYNAFNAPVVLQFFAYAAPGALALSANLLFFLILRKSGLADAFSMPGAFLLSAGVNHLLCTTFIFRRRARWTPIAELALALLLVAVGTVVDYLVAQHLLALQMTPLQAKAAACMVGLVLLFGGMRYLVFPEASTGSWNSQLRR